MKAKRRTGQRARTSLILGTCILLVLCLAYVLSSGEGAESLSDRLDVVMMVIAVLALVSPFFILLRTAGATEAEDEAGLARRLGQAVARAAPLTRSHMGGDRVPVRVSFTFRPSPHVRSATRPLVPNGTLDGLVVDYRAVRPRRLVITGEPGAGKSVLARAFVAEFNRTRADEEPVAVLLPIGDWGRQESFCGWVVRHLVRDYGRPPAQAAQLMDSGLVLPVLDGLDELDKPGTLLSESRAQQMLDVLTGYQSRLEPAPVVLTCRTDLYDVLEASGRPMLDAARVEIDPVEAQEAVRFLAMRQDAIHREGDWRPVLDELRAHPQGVLARSLSTPWRLVAMATAYEQVHDPRELLGARTDQEVTDGMFARFISASVHAVGYEDRYSPERAHAWLHHLALGLVSQNGGANALVLPELARSPGAWPSRMLYAVTVSLLTLVSLWAFLLNGTRGSAEWGVSLLVVAMAVLALLHLRPRGYRLIKRSDMWLPPWRSPLWSVASKVAFTGRNRWGVLASAILPVMILWRSVTPEQLGGIGDWTLALAVLPMLTLYVGLMAGNTLDTAAIGPSGWPRGGVFTALVLGWPAVVLLGLGLRMGLGVTDCLPLLAVFGVLYCAVSGDSAMYLCWLLIHFRRVPFRLSRFLDWCHAAGLIRITGGVYQFRHREFQEWLARHPAPLTRPTAPASDPATARTP
ncbi:NACHT domain-containing protein [Streptomyces sp. ME02-6979.5a]|uniref:NACHT domain-containing protein n=1 Tax=Streptomyces sp. ME02-6979.5a TaxID=462925 RepID=UPI0029A2A7EC|nr:NACHT domain-containing protein [Streptomyces sp. ME02-6979.5a]MDX3339895.1 NACHT domain-containing protein [Streptomyces sp. ME02-6979.5a]